MKHWRRSIRTAIIVIWVILIFGTISLAVKTPWKNKTLRELNVFAWADYIPLSVIEDFEKETNIHVNLHHFSSNEELLVKMRSTKGREYDMIIPSDYAVRILIDEKLLKPIDKEKVSYYRAIAPFLLDQSFDPKNVYSIPHLWEIYGFGVDREALTEVKDLFENPSLDYLFQPRLKNTKIVMTPDPVEAIALGAQYLYGITDQLSLQQAAEVQQLLIDQKQWIEAYADYRAKYLISTKNCPIAILRSSAYYQIRSDSPFIEFLLPKGPVFASIENLVISNANIDEESVYSFINFLFRPDIYVRLMNFCPLYPSVLHIADQQIDYPSFQPEIDQILKRNSLQYFHYLVDENEMRRLWAAVKSH